LPDGLSYDDTAKTITGTPTKADKFFVKFDVTAGTCTQTSIREVVISP